MVLFHDFAAIHGKFGQSPGYLLMGFPVLDLIQKFTHVVTIRHETGHIGVGFLGHVGMLGNGVQQWPDMFIRPGSPTGVLVLVGLTGFTF
jgi:hypothetical protein